MRNTKIYSIILGMTVFALASSLALATEKKPIKIKFAHIGGPDAKTSVIHACAVSFKYTVEKRSSGRFQVDIYPGGSLGKELDMIEAIRNNVIQVHMASMGGVGRIYPPAYLYMAPYMFRNGAIAKATVDGPIGQKLNDDFTKKTEIKGLGFIDIGAFMVITNNVRQIRHPADMKGIKFRGMDPLQVAMFKSLGASAVPIAWAELYTSLQTGVVQGQTNPTFMVSWAKLYEVQKYLTQANTQLGGQMLVCSKKWFDALSREDKLIVRDAAKNAQTTARGFGIVLEQLGLEDMKKKGMDIYALSDSETFEFQRLARPGTITWLKTKIDPELVDEFLKAIENAETELGY
jgi:tripartite ATP-independent transporter DctP family solute receptor